MNDHLSFTQISTYMSCPLKYSFQYIEKIAWPFKPEGLVFGTGIHQSLEHFYLGQMETRDVPVDELVAIFDASWEKEEAENTIRYKNGNTAEKLHDIAGKMLSIFKKKVAPGEILAVEKPFSIDLVDPDTQISLGIPLVGRIDLIERIKNGKIAVVDQKTACRAYTKDKVEHDLQLTAYSYVMNREGHDVDDITLRFDVLMKNGAFNLISYETLRTSKDHSRFIKIIKSVISGIESGTFYPIKSFMCTDCVFSIPCSKW